MLALLLTRKWVGLTVLVVVLIVGFGALSAWQWQRAQRQDVAAPVPSSTVLGEAGLATSDYGTRVQVSGRYDAAHQTLVQHSPTSYWVVTPLVPDDGRAVPVARATVSSPQDPAVRDVTAGTVDVVGVAQPYEGDPGTPSALPPGQVPRLTSAALALPYPVTGGWIALESQEPAAAVAADPVVPPVGSSAPSPLRLQNLSYAVQWVLFAGFVMFFWWRMFRDDLRGTGRRRPPQGAPPVREVY